MNRGQTKKINQKGGDATALPIEWYQPCDQQCQRVQQVPVSQCGGNQGQCGGGRQGQRGGNATDMPRVFYNPAAGDKCASCACGTTDYIDYFYRGNCARCAAREADLWGPSNPNSLPDYGCNLPGSVQDMRLSERQQQQQTGGSTFGAPFATQTFGCASTVPGMKGLSYRFNECDVVTGVNFRPL
jgi:hypothetical protein